MTYELSTDAMPALVHCPCPHAPSLTSPDHADARNDLCCAWCAVQLRLEQERRAIVASSHETCDKLQVRALPWSRDPLGPTTYFNSELWMCLLFVG